MEQVELDTVSKMENEGYADNQKRDDANNRGSNFVPMGYNAAGETERERDLCWRYRVQTPNKRDITQFRY